MATIQLSDAFLPSCIGSRAWICIVSGEFLLSFLHLKTRPVTTGNVEPTIEYLAGKCSALDTQERTMTERRTVSTTTERKTEQQQQQLKEEQYQQQ